MSFPLTFPEFHTRFRDNPLCAYVEKTDRGVVARFPSKYSRGRLLTYDEVPEVLKVLERFRRDVVRELDLPSSTRLPYTMSAEEFFSAFLAPYLPEECPIGALLLLEGAREDLSECPEVQVKLEKKKLLQGYYRVDYVFADEDSALVLLRPFHPKELVEILTSPEFPDKLENPGLVSLKSIKDVHVHFRQFLTEAVRLLPWAEEITIVSVKNLNLSEMRLVATPTRFVRIVTEYVVRSDDVSYFMKEVSNFFTYCLAKPDDNREIHLYSGLLKYGGSRVVTCIFLEGRRVSKTEIFTRTVKLSLRL